MGHRSPAAFASMGTMGKNTGKSKKKKRNPILIVILAAFTMMFVFSAVMLARELLQAKEEADSFNELSSIKQVAVGGTATKAPRTARPVAGPTPQVSGDAAAQPAQGDRIEDPNAAGEPSGLAEGGEPSERTMLPQYAALYEQNPELFGWITIPDTNIDYPVMHSPSRPNFYLSHNFYGAHAAMGVPYMDEDCDPNGKIFLVYGHHPSLGTMFSHIIDYEDQAFWETHQEIYFDTLYEERLYVVAIAMRARVLDKGEENGFRYYQYTSLNMPEIFEEYMSQAKGRALYDTGIDVSYGDELLVLSTCYHYTRNGRFVLIAKRVA